MRHRRGVTLIELLVVIAIITVIATLIVAVAPRFGERQRATRGAGMLQSWLNLAKQRAVRDQRPVGIRMPASATPYIGELLYVEAPDEGIGGTVTVPFPPGNNPPDYRYVQYTTTLSFTPNDPRTSPPNSPTATIQAGDVLSFPDRPMATYGPRRIASTPGLPLAQPDDSVALVGSDTSKSPVQYIYKLRLDQPLPAIPFTTTIPLFVRKPRPVVGEPVLQMPKDIAIDLTQDQLNSPPTYWRLYPPANSGGPFPFDIMFSPSGQVVGMPGVSRICLWVRDVSLGDPGPSVLPPGENMLITVYTRTGHVTSHPVDPAGLVPTTNPNNPTWNPFRFTQDAMSSGQ
jgi:prepilin-type N-terminal cleavage/methylation domain-containing protein